MRVVLVGPPGSGKGTQAKLLSERLNLVHIGTGDILREAVRQGSAAGRMAEPYVRTGKLVPDSLVNELVADLFRRDDRPEHFVLDGYPRTLAQAAAFDLVLRQTYLNLCLAVLLVVHDEEIVRRLSGRWSCPRCKSTYHLVKAPPRNDTLCDKDGTQLIQREDDREDTIRKRLQVYRDNTMELIPHYRAQGLLREVPGEGDIEKIHATLVQVLNQVGPSC